MAKQVGRITVEVEIDEGVYWPEPIRAEVERQDDDPIKDNWSHLAAHVVHSMNGVPGLQVQTIVMEQGLL